MLGQLVAHDEGLCTLELAEYKAAVEALYNFDQELGAYIKLHQYSLAIHYSSLNTIPKSKRSGKGLFLVLMPKETEAVKKHTVKIRYYQRKESQEAIRELNKCELSDNYLVAVLVSAEGTRSLRQAYPNYFGSTQIISKFFDNKIEEYKKILATENIELKAQLKEREKEVNAQIKRLREKKEPLTEQEATVLKALEELDFSF